MSTVQKSGDGRCPKCDSPSPELHPSVQFEGEVELCSDAFHAIATFRLLLYQEPAKALAAFLAATGGEYQGTCKNCEGKGTIRTSALWLPELAGNYGWTPSTRPLEASCLTCHGTGGPPSPDLKEIAADWFEERGCEVEAGALRGIAK